MSRLVEELVARVGGVLVGKEHVIRLSVACLLARGHLLIEDVPGVGKTTLSHAMARALGLDFRRIQFTSDLLPSDVVGNAIFDKEKGRFVFHAGPIFAHFVLIDEVNRATPRTQSALLEAMEEEQVTVDGTTHPLPRPFFVVATQNPAHQTGTFPLPESQLDRFLMRIEVGYPDRAHEREMLKGGDRRKRAREMGAVMAFGEFAALQDAAGAVHVSEALYDYLQDVVEATRGRHRAGLSPRGALDLLSAARAWALMRGRDAVLPEDVQAVGEAVMAHRLGAEGRTLARDILDTVRVD